MQPASLLARNSQLERWQNCNSQLVGLQIRAGSQSNNTFHNSIEF